MAGVLPSIVAGHDVSCPYEESLRDPRPSRSGDRDANVAKGRRYENKETSEQMAEGIAKHCCRARYIVPLRRIVARSVAFAKTARKAPGLKPYFLSDVISRG